MSPKGKLMRRSLLIVALILLTGCPVKAVHEVHCIGNDGSVKAPMRGTMSAALKKNAFKDVFCEIAAHERPATIIAETKDLMVIKSERPRTPIHYIIFPKCHIKDLLELHDYSIGAEMFKMAQKLACKLGTREFKLVINNGHEAGQKVFHLHMHFMSGPGKIPDSFKLFPSKK